MNRGLEELFDVAGIPRARIATPEEILVEARRLHEEVGRLRSVRWQWFAWGLAIGSIVGRLVR